MSAPYDVRSVEHFDGYRLRVSFADGTGRVADLTHKLSGHVGRAFGPSRDEKFFAQATVDPDIHAVVWPNGADLTPEALHDGAIEQLPIS